MITIYWGINPVDIPEGLRIDPPVPIMNKFFKDRISEDVADEITYNKCPALFNELTNVYGMKSVYDYGFQIKDDQLVRSNYHVKPTPLEASDPGNPEEFFKKHVIIRSNKGKLFSFNQGLVFFTEIPSLMMSQLPPFMEDNNIMENAITIPGQFDIGKYFRCLDFAWHLRDGCDEIYFSRKEITFYLKFATKEKIKFQRFLYTPELFQYGAMIAGAKNSKKSDVAAKFKSKALDYYYNIFDRSNLKNKILKIIKENLCKEEDSEGNIITKIGKQ